LDHGYAVTSHSAQGTTADRVVVHAEGGQSSALVNQRFAYVSGSRMREGLQVYTDDSHRLESSLSRPFDKSAAVSERSVSQSHGRLSTDSAQSQNTKAPGHSQTQAGGHQDVGHGH
jgi:ATP-dependent exoDNAse (exonuclease V) alpha subunit